MQEDLDSNAFQFDLNDRGLVAERDRILRDMDLSKAQTISSTAQNIAALKPYMS